MPIEACEDKNDGIDEEREHVVKLFEEMEHFCSHHDFAVVHKYSKKHDGENARNASKLGYVE